MKKKSYFLGIIITSVSIISIGCSIVALTSMNKRSLLATNAASNTYTLTCNNFSTFVSNGYLTTKNGNKIRFNISNCSGNKINPDGYFQNSTKFASIKNVKMTYSSTMLADAICYYTNNTDNFFYGYASNYVLQSGKACSDLGSTYIRVSNPASFNNNGVITVSSFVITYTCS